MDLVEWTFHALRENSVGFAANRNGCAAAAHPDGKCNGATWRFPLFLNRALLDLSTFQNFMECPKLTFEEWKRLLRQDCERQAKLPAFDSLGDYCLTLLWDSDIEPSVQAIIDGVSKAA